MFRRLEVQLLKRLQARPLAVGFVKTVLRYAMTNGIFCEPSPGHASHTGLSLLLLKDPLARAFASNNTDGVFPGTAKVAEALGKWSEAEGPNHTGLQLACGTEKSMFEWYASGLDEAKGQMETFAGSMRYWSSREDFLISHVVNGFDWASLPKDAVVVDVSLLSDPLSICTEDKKLIYSRWSYIPGKAHKHCNFSGKSKPTSSWLNSAKLGRSQRESLISRVVQPSRLQIC